MENSSKQGFASNSSNRFFKAVVQHRSPLFGVGKYIESLHKLSDSFSTAKESLHIQIQANIPHQIFYENLHIYRLVSILHKQGHLLEYMNEYLGSVIDYPSTA